MNEVTDRALFEVLDTLSHEDLLKLIKIICKEDEQSKRILIKNLKIPLRFTAAQPQNPRQIEKLKHDIDQFIKFRQEEYDDGYDGFPDTDYSELDVINQEANLLNPIDQIEVYYYLLTKIEEIYADIPVGASELKDTIRQYGQAVRQLSLKTEEKRNYFDFLTNALQWEMTDFSEDMITAIKDAMDSVCENVQDYRFVIEILKKNKSEQADEIIAEFYLKLHDDENYLKVRNENLTSEEQFLDLAGYWKNRGDTEKYRDTLEEWVVRLTARKEPEFTYSSPKDDVLSGLAAYYTSIKDDTNLLRILLVKAKYKERSLALYIEIQTIAKRLGRIEESKHSFIYCLKKYEAQILAEVYIYEKEYQKALDLAEDGHINTSVSNYVAEQVKKDYPHDAIFLYQTNVRVLIFLKDRKAYHEAAVLMGKIKSIYLSILNDSVSWEKYIGGIRREYNRLPALKDEIKAL
jgi:uncharacterized protein YfaT (DUF1175 family)